MAYHRSNSFMFCILVASFSIVGLIARPTTKADDLIASVCSKTRDPSLCNHALQADPRSATADLKGLGFISIDIASKNATQTSNLIASLLNSTTDPTLKDRYDTCAETYQDSISLLAEAGQALNGGDIETFRTKASAAFDGPSTCDDSFDGPPEEPPQLQQANKELKGLCSITLVVGALLSAE